MRARIEQSHSFGRRLAAGIELAFLSLGTAAGMCYCLSRAVDNAYDAFHASLAGDERAAAAQQQQHDRVALLAGAAGTASLIAGGAAAQLIGSARRAAKGAEDAARREVTAGPPQPGKNPAHPTGQIAEAAGATAIPAIFTPQHTAAQ